MGNNRLSVLVARWTAVVLLLLALGYVINTSGCNTGESELRKFGESMGQEVKTGSAPSNHKYVGHIQQKLYWPNKKKYVDRIPDGSHVYIYDDEQLAKFKGYKPGPL